MKVELWHYGTHVTWELYLWAPPQRPQHWSECKAWSRTGRVPLDESTSSNAAVIAALEDLLDRLRDRDH